MTSGGTEYLATCPRPGTTFAALRGVFTDPDWRRMGVIKTTNVAWTPTSADDVLELRMGLIRELWPDFASTPPWIAAVNFTGTGQWDGPGEDSAFLALSVFPVGDYSQIFFSADIPSIVSGPSDFAVDVAAVWYFVKFIGGYWFAVPENADDREQEASGLQWPGGGDTINSDEIGSINTLADAINLAAGREGRVENHKSETLLQFSGNSGTLPPNSLTTDTALRRLASAVRNFWGGNLILTGKRPKAQVAVGRGVIVRG